MGIACQDTLNVPMIIEAMNVSMSEFDWKDMYYLETPTWEPNACGSNMSFVYFITYTISVTFVILNLFIAVIFEGFEEGKNSKVGDLIQSCVDTWDKYDPNHRMVLSLERALDFIDDTMQVLCKFYGKADDPMFELI